MIPEHLGIIIYEKSVKLIVRWTTNRYEELEISREQAKELRHQLELLGE